MNVELENLKQVVQQTLMLPDDARLELIIQANGILIVPADHWRRSEARKMRFAQWDAASTTLSAEQAAALKEEFSDEDIALAEALLPDYGQNLRAEDSK